MLDGDRSRMVGENVRQTPIGLRRFVEVGAQQRHATLAQPRLHLIVADSARLPDFLPGGRILDETAAGFGSRHHTAGAVNRRVQAVGRDLALDAGQDHRVVAHRSADKAALAGKRRRRALAHHPQFTVAVRLPPRIVVVVVHGVDDLTADDLAHALDHPLAAGIGILARQRHGRDVLAAEITVLMQDAGRHVDAILAAAEFKEFGRGLVTQTTRTEVHADPDPAVLILEQVDIVVAGPDRPELIARHGLQVLDLRNLVPDRALEQRMIDLLVIAAANAKADMPGDVGQDRALVGGDLVQPDIQLHRHVAAADVESDAADGDMLLIGDDAADRLRIAEMPVGTQHRTGHTADGHAALHLRDGLVVMLAKNLDVAHFEPPVLIDISLAARAGFEPARRSGALTVRWVCQFPHRAKE